MIESAILNTYCSLPEALSDSNMFSGSYEACGNIIPVSYVQQAQNARKSRENQIRTFLEHVSIVNYDKISCGGLDFGIS